MNKKRVVRLAILLAVMMSVLTALSGCAAYIFGGTEGGTHVSNPGPTVNATVTFWYNGTIPMFKVDASASVDPDATPEIGALEVEVRADGQTFTYGGPQNQELSISFPAIVGPDGCVIPIEQMKITVYDTDVVQGYAQANTGTCEVTIQPDGSYQVVDLTPNPVSTESIVAK